MASSHYLNQCWFIVIWILRNIQVKFESKDRFFLYQKDRFFLYQICIWNFLCQIWAILFRPVFSTVRHQRIPSAWSKPWTRYWWCFVVTVWVCCGFWSLVCLYSRKSKGPETEGIKVGDRLLEVNGTPVVNHSVNEVRFDKCLICCNSTKFYENLIYTWECVDNIKW